MFKSTVPAEIFGNRFFESLVVVQNYKQEDLAPSFFMSCRSSNMLVPYCNVTQCYIAEDLDSNLYHLGNLKSHI